VIPASLRQEQPGDKLEQKDSPHQPIQSDDQNPGSALFKQNRERDSRQRPCQYQQIQGALQPIVRRSVLMG
jgi:hypothetical protein